MCAISIFFISISDFLCSLFYRCLTDEELYRDYLAAEAWLDYRKKVVQSVIDCKEGRFIAHVSATAKGSSGWTTWPGSQQGT